MTSFKEELSSNSINSNQSQLCLIQAPDQRIYIGMHDPAVRYPLQFTFEQRPSTRDWDSAEVPQGYEISGIPVHLEFRTAHFVFYHPRSTVQLAPVVLYTYSGDWHAGLDVYKQWRATWFPTPKIPAWAKDVHSWFQLQVNGAEQDYTVPYRDIVRFGEECADSGVTAFQLVGWSKDGQDGGDPSLDTNPGLGTWQDLYDSIAKVQARGVKMVLFGKPHIANMATDWYRKELYKYEATDPYGDRYESTCCSYTTPTQLAGINVRRRAVMDACCKIYRDIAVHEFSKILALGASGWLFDEVLEHNGALYPFSPDHGYSAPGYLFSGDLPLVKQFRAAADKVNPDFLSAGEGPGDWLLPCYVLGYYRISPALYRLSGSVDGYGQRLRCSRGTEPRSSVSLHHQLRAVRLQRPCYRFPHDPGVWQKDRRAPPQIQGVDVGCRVPRHIGGKCNFKRRPSLYGIQTATGKPSCHRSQHGAGRPHHGDGRGPKFPPWTMLRTRSES